METFNLKKNNYFGLDQLNFREHIDHVYWLVEYSAREGNPKFFEPPKHFKACLDFSSKQSSCTPSPLEFP